MIVQGLSWDRPVLMAAHPKSLSRCQPQRDPTKSMRRSAPSGTSGGDHITPGRDWFDVRSVPGRFENRAHRHTF